MLPLPGSGRNHSLASVQPSNFPGGGTLRNKHEYDAVAPFLEQFRNLGWVEGKHFVMEKRFAPAGQSELLAPLAAELVQHHVDIIVTVSTGASILAPPSMHW